MTTAFLMFSRVSGFTVSLIGSFPGCQNQPGLSSCPVQVRFSARLQPAIDPLSGIQEDIGAAGEAAKNPSGITLRLTSLPQLKARSCACGPVAVMYKVMLSPTVGMRREQVLVPAPSCPCRLRTDTPSVEPWLDQCFDQAERELPRLQRLFCGEHTACSAGMQLPAGGVGGSVPAGIVMPMQPMSVVAELPRSNLVRL